MEKRVYYSRGNNFNPVGVVKSLATLTIPSGWLLCDGSWVSKTIYENLYTVIGDSFGVPDPSLFRLPDFSGRFVCGKDTSDTLGCCVGFCSFSHAHTIPGHGHSVVSTRLQACPQSISGYLGTGGSTSNNCGSHCHTVWINGGYAGNASYGVPSQYMQNHNVGYTVAGDCWIEAAGAHSHQTCAALPICHQHSNPVISGLIGYAAGCFGNNNFNTSAVVEPNVPENTIAIYVIKF